MNELHKTDNLIRLSLYELIRVLKLFREYMTMFTIFSILYCPAFIAYRGNTVFKQNTKAAKVRK